MSLNPTFGFAKAPERSPRASRAEPNLPIIPKLLHLLLFSSTLHFAGFTDLNSTNLLFLCFGAS